MILCSSSQSMRAESSTDIASPGVLHDHPLFCVESMFVRSRVVHNKHQIRRIA